MAGELTAIEQLENEVNDRINKMRRASVGIDRRMAANHPEVRALAADMADDDDADRPKPEMYTGAKLLSDTDGLVAKLADAVANNAGDPVFAANAPKLKELAFRLATAREHFNGRVASGVVPDDAEFDVADPGVAAPGVSEPVERAETRPDVLSSPMAGQEPRYVVQHNGEPDPIAVAKPSPPSEHAGARSPEEADLMRDAEGGDAPKRRTAASPQTAVSHDPAAQQRQRQEEERRAAEAKRQADARAAAAAADKTKR